MKIEIELTNEQIKKLGLSYEWVDVQDHLPSDGDRCYDVCTATGKIYCSCMIAGSFPSNVVMWREIPEPPLKQLMERRQQKMEL